MFIFSEYNLNIKKQSERPRNIGHKKLILKIYTLIHLKSLNIYLNEKIQKGMKNLMKFSLSIKVN